MEDTRPNLSPMKTGLYDPDYEHDACGVAFIVDIKGRRSHEIVSKSLTALRNLQHRGASGAEKNTGDGAGITLQIPHQFFLAELKKLKIKLPDAEAYGVGMVFLPGDLKDLQKCAAICENIIAKSGQEFLGWRDVPQNNILLGKTAKQSEPVIRQFFVRAKPASMKSNDFERRLYLIRRRIETAVLSSDITHRQLFYISSLSSKTIVYKGMLSADQITTYYPDLLNPLFISSIALVHQRFSTNTFPSWSLAHPYRYLAHNGEINTLQGNKNSMRAREHILESKFFGKEIKDLLPVIQEGGSDSQSLDNVLEMLVMTGRSLPHAMMMLIPQPWSKNNLLSSDLRAFYDYHSSLQEPWDGPALVAFTDGARIGAILDRNGLRPARYYVTKDGLVIMASEVGVIDVKPADILEKGRLQPGKMLLIDTKLGEIIPDEQLKKQIAAEKPYQKWLKKYRVSIDKIPRVKTKVKKDKIDLLAQQLLFGYTEEEKRMILTPMAADGREPIGSMGNDTPIAVLSLKPQNLFNYFRQLFAQVTNPPLDAIREELVTSFSVLLGSKGDLLEPLPVSCRQLELPEPVLAGDTAEAIRGLNLPGLKTKTLKILFSAGLGEKGLEMALEQLFQNAEKAIINGFTILYLTDQGSTDREAPIPSLLAVAGLYHYLVRRGLRTKVSIVIAAGDAREIHHFCCLIGFGASAIYPYLAYETLGDLTAKGTISLDREAAIANYIKASNTGILKVMSKMGISTLDGYRGAQIFEAVGLSQSFINKYFTYTSSRIGGNGLASITKDVLALHNTAFPKDKDIPRSLDAGGEYKWRRDSTQHFLTPEIIGKLQHAVRTNNYAIFKEYTRLVENLNQGAATIRGLLSFKNTRKPIPLSEVESVDSIVRRFATGAMSYGAISQEAHETLAIAANRIGSKSNSGEGGEDPARFVPDANGDSRNSAIKQVASARFGVTSEYLANAQDIQIKMAQGAKPGEGGHLPGAKVYPWIARVRHSTPHVGLISPPPHHDIYSIEDLAQLIYDLKNSNPEARIGVKLVAEVGVGTVAAGVAKAHADMVLISGSDGGTGAAPLSSIKHSGIPWEIGLAETQQVLLKNGLRDRIVVQVDGQLKTGRDVIIAALLGAEEFGFATSALITLGCVMMRVCHLDSCPVGIATQNPALRKRFSGKPVYVQNFLLFLAKEVQEYLAELGFRTMDEIIGRSDLLNIKPALDHWKNKGIDLSMLLKKPDSPLSSFRCIGKQDHGLENALDHKLIALCKDALENNKKIRQTFPIRNIHRTVGTMLGHEITKRFGGEGLPGDTIKFTFKGSAGQSFGAFMPKGLTLVLEGDANDHVGKGLSGGKIIVKPSGAVTFDSSKNIIIGNVALYGATDGEAYINGVAGERFAVRNSGARAVVEGVGDHGCEYMTSGSIVVLGPTGRNFAAGMSGGTAFVLDENQEFNKYCNLGMVELEKLLPEDEVFIYGMIKQHLVYTGSPLAKKILSRWKKYLSLFVKVMPVEYKLALFKAKQNQEQLPANQNQTIPQVQNVKL